MKIRTGFVSNSSSTSFLIISKEAFTKEQLIRLVGVDKESPLYDLFDQLYEELIDSTRVKVELGSVKGNANWTHIMGPRAPLCQ